MRTTLVISDPVYKRAKKVARENGMRLSALATEAMEEFLLRMEAAGKRSKPRAVHLESFSMGPPQVDIDDREQLYRRMEEE